MAEEQKPRPRAAVVLTSTEAELLTAWKRVMDANHWAETLLCATCFANHEQIAHCQCETVPDKRIRIYCPCSTRDWQGVTK